MSTETCRASIAGRGDLGLPVQPSGRLAEVLATTNPIASARLAEHLMGGTSADWLATTLTGEGFPIAASTLKAYRRTIRLHDEGSV